MNWFVIGEIIYVVLLVLICMRIIYDTSTTTKTLAYLLIVIFLPFIGIFIYFSVGINYRKRKLYDKKLLNDEVMMKKLKEVIVSYSKQVLKEGDEVVQKNKELAYMLLKDSLSPLSAGNEVKLLVNGEKKFPDVIPALESAKHHIHIEYYIYEDDTIGRAIEEILIRKAKEGVKVRFIYDDFGSRTIRKKMAARLRNAGVEVYPFYKITLIAFANRLKYRNHRKIIVVDGTIGFVGGINVSDKYVNEDKKVKKLFWRDTHMIIKGPGVHYLQYLFLCDWNFCTSGELQPDNHLFPPPSTIKTKDDKIIQIAASGPDSDRPLILLSLLQAINLASKEVLITTPYFVPDDSIINAMISAALGGVQVKMLVPGVSDSVIVNAAARSYYDELLSAGVEIYLYKKGFVHAKTLVSDREISIVGTANMDHRSLELNFEVNAIVYDKEFSNELAEIFYEDIKDSEKIDKEQWEKRSFRKKMFERTARLISPLI